MTALSFPQILNPKLTTVEQQSRKIGMLAARELIACIENPKTALVKRVVVDGRLLEGETVKRHQTKVNRCDATGKETKGYVLVKF